MYRERGIGISVMWYIFQALFLWERICVRDRSSTSVMAKFIEGTEIANSKMDFAVRRVRMGY